MDAVQFLNLLITIGKNLGEILNISDFFFAPNEICHRIVVEKK